ncbi:MAG: ABC transporter substrate-binding protein [Lachnospiraceae bacterium]|nr:ABC transporter substrate-binding protein [Lachnospiraceae bacterium]
MRKSNKVTAVLLSGMLAAGMLAGCGGSGDSSSAASDSSASTSSAASEEKAANREGEVNQEAYQTNHATATDKILTFGIQEYSIGVDPAQEINTAWNCSRYGLGECLFRFDNSMNVMPWLCDEYSVNDEHTEWVFHIREGVKFSDGCDLTPAAVKASIERLFEVGKDGSSKPGTFLSEEAELIVDEKANTLTIVTPEPVVDLTKNLCHPVMTVIDTEHTENYVEAPICTGPYAASEFTEHVGMTVVRNENYWNGEVPYASIELIYMGDASAKAMALQADQVDLVENITNIADLDSLRDNENYTVTIAPGIRTGICHLNVAEGKTLSNDTLRHAIIKAIDFDTMCSVTVGGLYTSGFSVLPSTLDYGYENLENPDPYDPEEAMRILDEAGIVDTNGDGNRELEGEEIMLKYVTYPNRCLDVFAEAVQHQLSEIGIGVDLIISDGAGQWDSYQSSDFDINSSNWNTAATGDPCEYMNAWLGDCEANYSGYNNEEYNELFAKLQKTYDNDERRDIIQRMQQILIDDAAAIPLGYYNSSMISNNAIVGGAAINTADYYWVTTDIYPAE